MSAEIATTAGESVSYTWKRAAAAGEYWRSKYLCLTKALQQLEIIRYYYKEVFPSLT